MVGDDNSSSVITWQELNVDHISEEELDDDVMPAYVEVLFDYTPEDPKSSVLELKKGDVIRVIDNDDKEFWYGECDGTVGYFPSKLIKVYTSGHGSHGRERFDSSATVSSASTSDDDVEEERHLPRGRRGSAGIIDLKKELSKHKEPTEVDRMSYSIAVERGLKDVANAYLERFPQLLAEEAEKALARTGGHNTDVYKYEDLEFGALLGEGAFAKVFKSQLHGQEVAVKVLKKEGMANKGTIDDFKTEVEMLSLLRHPSIVQFVGAIWEPEMCIITELCTKGNLESLLHRLQKSEHIMSVNKILKLFKKLAKGLIWLHAKGIIHRDFKPANILIDEQGNPKIADFGISHMKGTSAAAGEYGQAGSGCYMAPEVLGNETYGTRADVYSFGMVLFEVLLSNNPWDDHSVNYSRKLFEGWRPEIPDTVPEYLRDLIRSCWQNEWETRPSMNEVLQKLEQAEKQYQASHLISVFEKYDLQPEVEDAITTMQQNIANQEGELEEKEKEIVALKGEKKAQSYLLEEVLAALTCVDATAMPPALADIFEKLRSAQDEPEQLHPSRVDITEAVEPKVQKDKKDRRGTVVHRPHTSHRASQKWRSKSVKGNIASLGRRGASDASDGDRSPDSTDQQFFRGKTGSVSGGMRSPKGKVSSVSSLVKPLLSSSEPPLPKISPKRTLEPANSPLLDDDEDFLSF